MYSLSKLCIYTWLFEPLLLGYAITTTSLFAGLIYFTECDLPDAPTFGSYTVFNGNNDLRFSCENGYSVKGSSELVCLQDGSGYNGPAPACGKMFKTDCCKYIPF